MRPRLEAVGLGWVNFQVMRRTHASLMNKLEVDPKVVAEQLGHTLDVNLNVYTEAGHGASKRWICSKNRCSSIKWSRNGAGR